MTTEEPTSIPQPQPITTELDHAEDEDKPFSVQVLPAQRKEIIRKYLEGKDKRDLADEYGLTVRGITSIVEGNADMRLELEKRYIATANARENYRIAETKNKLISFIDSTLDEVANDPQSMTTEGKLKILNNIAALFDKLAIAGRLNADKPTNITENRELKVNIAEIMEQLQTPEDKLNFLRGQTAKNNNAVYAGEVVKS